MVNKSIIKILVQHGLKVTPQRIAILDVLFTLKNHPTIENVSEYLRLNYPHISIGTVYKTLHTFSSKGIIKKVYPDIQNVRYDIITKKHHHLYSSENERIEDFYDEALNKILDNYLKIKNFPDFKIEDIQVQIIGKFVDITR